MTTPTHDSRLLPAQFRAELCADAIRGMTAPLKWLPPRWLYDARGSELFEMITTLPGYYPFSTERAILAQHSPAITDLTGARTLVELGSGAGSDKSRLLLESLNARHPKITYAPIDVSASALAQAVADLSGNYPDLTVTPHAGDFTADLSLPPLPGPKLFALLGGTFGNLLPDDRAAFLRRMRSRLAPGDRFVLGVDLVKDPDVILAAYTDPAGISAQFALNLCVVLNRELRADFDLDGFEYLAQWDDRNEWVDMRLRSRHAQTVELRDLGLQIHFAQGEDLRTEISAKFRPRGLADEVARSGLAVRHWWTDAGHLYGLALMARDDDPTPPR